VAEIKDMIPAARTKSVLFVCISPISPSSVSDFPHLGQKTVSSSVISLPQFGQINQHSTFQYFLDLEEL
jgi:hypothetical protein